MVDLDRVAADMRDSGDTVDATPAGLLDPQPITNFIRLITVSGQSRCPLFHLRQIRAIELDWVEQHCAAQPRSARATISPKAR
jgi:hypothetical protein